MHTDSASDTLACTDDECVCAKKQTRRLSPRNESIQSAVQDPWRLANAFSTWLICLFSTQLNCYLAASILPVSLMTVCILPISMENAPDLLIWAVCLFAYWQSAYPPVSSQLLLCAHQWGWKRLLKRLGRGGGMWGVGGVGRRGVPVHTHGLTSSGQLGLRTGEGEGIGNQSSGGVGQDARHNRCWKGRARKGRG